MLADLPNLRALMTTQHEATIQDASSDLWRLAGSDLFVLADRPGRWSRCIPHLRDFDRDMAQQSLPTPWPRKRPAIGGLADSISTRFFSSPFTSGPRADNQLLGFLVIGYEIDDRVARR